MGRWNSTSVPGFILMGLIDSAETQLVLSMLFLLIYLVTVLGNAGMIMIIRLDPQLHSPMYFFLIHLSFLDLSYSSVIAPKTLQSLLTSTRSISFLGSFTQLYFFIVFGAAECLLLSSMAYDRYVAICSPLHYPVIISTGLCHALLTGSYVIGFVDSTVNAVSMSQLHFCKSSVIQHFFCDSSPILALSCSDTYEVKISIFIFAGCTLVLSLITISGSYVSILSTILKINSTAGNKKKRLLYLCLLYLCLPSPGSHHLLQQYHLYLPKTENILLLGKGSGGFCVLHDCDPHAEPSHLQSQKQKGEESCPESPAGVREC
ncbi:Olfactory receptor 8H3 [Heterocephalus glaber]|uniref:Olfactory receptor n=1 Tax=Heterocephalus glaber TaxID=10181 RepID=G5BMA4_HETGA|nr:Olfactory receptor 8H3 [Heterocephalus glaber]